MIDCCPSTSIFFRKRLMQVVSASAVDVESFGQTLFNNSSAENTRFGPHHHELQKREFLRQEIEFRSVASDVVVAAIDLDPCEFKCVVKNATRSAEKCAHTGRQFAAFKGFRQVIVGSRVQPLLFISDLVLAGQHQDRRLPAAGSVALHEFDA